MIMTCRKIPGCFLTHSGLGCISCAGEQKRYLTVNLLDGAESDITPAASLASFAPTGGDTRVHHAGIVETPLWPYLLVSALVVLMGEWYVWCRDF